jgi:replicative DNA helicase
VAQLEAELMQACKEREQYAQAADAMQAEIQQLMADSDRAVSSMLERMEGGSAVGEGDLAALAHHIDTSIAAFSMLNRKVEVRTAISPSRASPLMCVFQWCCLSRC